MAGGGGAGEPPSAESLLCPGCGRAHGPQQRFCRDCGLPLVPAQDNAALLEPLSERHAMARKIKPQLSEGRLVGVAVARNQMEGEFIQSMLLEEGVPSLLRRSAGFDVPDFLAAGPRDVLVPESGAATAREVLLQAEIVSAEPARGPVSAGRLLAGLLAALALGALIVWLLTQAIS